MTLQVFISYKSEYRDFARAVKSELNQWGFDTWLDVDNIQPGDYFRHKIQAGLDSSDVLLMVLTEEAQLSREVMSEVDYFLDVAKKPVVPLRHRECKPLYIFVSIQYIDFVTDQTNGFVQLKQRLSELAQSTVDLISDTAPEPAPMMEEAEKPGAAIIDDFIGGESEEKKETVEEDLFGAPALATENVPMPQPAPPPKPNIQPPSSPITSAPAMPVFEPSPQQEYMPQPARKSTSRSPMLWSLGAVASLIVIVGAVVLISSSATISITGQPNGTSPLVWVGVLVIIASGSLIVWWLPRNRAVARPPDSTASVDQKRRENAQQTSPAVGAGTGSGNAMGMGQNITITFLRKILRHKDFGDYALPPNTDIIKIFTDLNGEVLILGAPNDSKSLLLDLERKIKALLLQNNADLSTPFVLNLLSWTRDKSLNKWLLDEISQHYETSQAVVSSWIESQKLSLLLDGLEMMTEQQRNDCVEAINIFRDKYRAVDFAICGRVEDYDFLTSRFDISSAVVVQREFFVDELN